MAEIDAKIAKIAAVDASVLLLGESGTGKEVMTREIQRRSPRVADPLIDINCGGIPESLMESELFGCEKGAFTGADRTKPGLFEAANNSTLFLDEVADLTLGLQVKLLRVLQERTFRRVGGTKLLSPNVRIITATNKDIQRERELKRFRDDLVLQIELNRSNYPTDLGTTRRHRSACNALFNRFERQMRFRILDGAIDELEKYM